MTDNLDQVVLQLQGAGLDVDRPDVTGRVVRCKAEGDKGASKAGWYCLHEMRTRSGRTVIVGSYGNWRTGERAKVSLEGEATLSDEERAALRERIKKDRARAEQLRKRQQGRAARRADGLWRRLPESGESPYLQRKGVRAYGVRFGRRGTVVVPVRDALGQIHGLQVIYPSAAESRRGVDKDFWPAGLAKRGHFHLIGRPGAVLLICEGYATGASLHEATGLPVAVVFDTSNLRPAAEALRAAWPDTRLIFCADDDFETVRPVENPGVTYAHSAALVVDGQVVVPRFTDRDGRKLTDFNDLHQVEGLEAVREQVLAVAIAGQGPPGSKPPPPPGETGGSDGGGGWHFDLDTLLRHYVLIYPTETVFDERHCRIASLSALRAAAGKSLVRIWMEHPARRIVPTEKVVFDPGGTAEPGSVNLFRGWQLKPQWGRCEKLLELLHYLCGESDRVFEWVLNWTAYPLQHPGAKMRTAVIMHGPEGSGKNTWWGAIARIYGEYHGIITQTELESQFNSWCSRKLFIIGNEVVSRQEMYHQKGRIQNMITEDQWQVNEKMLPVRQEANHANIVFLSNAHQPATPNPDDRRFLVIWTPPKLSDEFYRAVAAEANNGGVEALYYHLLHLDLEGFDEHTKPPMTQAKEDLIEASMDSHERFFRQWKSGELPLSFVPCRSMDCYRAYRRWCDQRGERAPAPERIFLSAMGKRVAARNRERFMPPEGGQDVVQQRVIIPEEVSVPDGVTRQTWLSEQVGVFFRELQAWADSAR